MLGEIVKKWQAEFFQLCISDDMFQIKVPMFTVILVTISQKVKKWLQFFEIQDRGSWHLESTLPVEPPSREMNS